MLEGLHDNACVWVRYAGQCRSCTPLQRLRKDQGRTHGLYGAFLEALQHHPEIEAPAVYVFPRAELPETSEEWERDLHERIVIACLGLPYLLNQQAGGFYASYEPSPEAKRVWMEALSKGVRIQQEPLGMEPDEKVAEYQACAEQLQTKMASRPNGTGHYRWPMTAEGVTAIVKQALRGQFRGRTLALMLFKDVTMANFRDHATFHEGGSRTAHLVAELRGKLATWTAEAGAGGGQQTAPGGPEGPGGPASPQPIPVLNCWPCIRHLLLWLILWWLLCFLQAAVPLIILSFSGLAAEVASSNFTSCNTMPGMLDKVGQLQICSFARGQPGREEELCALLLIHMHPGHDKYGEGPPELRELLLAVWMLSEVLMHLMRAYLASAAAAGQSQRQIVEAVLALTRTDEAWQLVLAHLEVTKEAWRAYLHSRRNRGGRWPRDMSAEELPTMLAHCAMMREKRLAKKTARQLEAHIARLGEHVEFRRIQDGRKVLVEAGHRRFNLFWTTAEGVDRKVRVAIPDPVVAAVQAINQDPGKLHAFVHFLPRGIALSAQGIVGQLLEVNLRGVPGVVKRVGELQGELLELFNSELAEKGLVAEASYDSDGHPLVTFRVGQTMEGASFSLSLPIREQDAAWVAMRFCQEFFADSLYFVLMRPDARLHVCNQMCILRNILARFREFLDTPLMISHPHRAAWLRDYEADGKFALLPHVEFFHGAREVYSKVAKFTATQKADRELRGLPTKPTSAVLQLHRVPPARNPLLPTIVLHKEDMNKAKRKFSKEELRNNFDLSTDGKS